MEQFTAAGDISALVREVLAVFEKRCDKIETVIGENHTIVRQMSEDAFQAVFTALNEIRIRSIILTRVIGNVDGDIRTTD